MNRYNQGFGKFGPMEQEWNGKWVEYKEVDILEKRLLSKINNLTIESLTQQNEIDSLNLKNKSHVSTINNLIMFMCGLVAVDLLVIMLCFVK